MPRIPADNNGSTELNGSLPFLPLFPGDYHAVTQFWPPGPRVIYFELLCAQWAVGGLPDDEHQLRDRVRIPAKDWKESWPLVSPYFPVDTDGRRRNRRLEEHRLVSAKKSTQARDAALERWRKHPHMHHANAPANAYADACADGDAHAMHPHMHPSPSPSPRKRRTLRRGESLPPDASSGASSPVGARQKK